MRNSFSAGVAVVLWSLSVAAGAQEYRLVVNQAIAHDSRAPLHENDLLSPLDLEKANERGERPFHMPHPDLAHKPVSDPPTPASPTGYSSIGTPSGGNGLSVNGAGAGSYIPPDTTGAVGTTQYVQWVNAAYAVYDKQSLALLKSPAGIDLVFKGNTLWKGFGGGCETNNDGDPIVQFDKLANRWVMTQFSVSTTPYLQCIAISSSDDFVNSQWYRYAFSYSNYFNDYPKLSVWPNAYYITFNMFRGNFTGPWACAYDRAKMLTNAPATQVCFSISSSYASLMPADLDGVTPATDLSKGAPAPPPGSPGYFLSLGSGSCATISGATKGCLYFWKLTANFSSPSLSTLTRSTLYVNAFNRACGTGGTCIPQPGTTQQLASLGDRLMWRLAYRNFGDHEAMVVNHSVNTTVLVNNISTSVVGLRWYELRNAAGNTFNSATPVIYQQGTFAPDAVNRWMGSIGMDKMGNIAIGYSAAGKSLFPSIRLTGRAPGDSSGSLSSAESEVVTGGGSQVLTGYNVSRWGDYSSLSIDPSNDCTFYYTTEYLPRDGAWNWNTNISKFQFSSCN